VPFDTQQKDDDFKEYEAASALVARLAAMADQHIEQLNSALEGLGGHEASPVKSAVVQFEGFFAGAIDKMRKTKVSKALRDDYTAISLCCASYSLLLATANALGESGVASLAQRFLEDYAQLVMEIGEALPGVAVQELRANKIDVDTSTIERSRQQIIGAGEVAVQRPDPDAGSGRDLADWRLDAGGDEYGGGSSEQRGERSGKLPGAAPPGLPHSSSERGRQACASSCCLRGGTGS